MLYFFSSYFPEINFWRFAVSMSSYESWLCAGRDLSENLLWTDFPCLDRVKDSQLFHSRFVYIHYGET